MRASKSVAVSLVFVALTLMSGCTRQAPQKAAPPPASSPAADVVEVPPTSAAAEFQREVGQFGDPAGTGFTCQCTGTFPDWIVEHPVALETSFRLSQDYPTSMPGPTNLIPADPTPWKNFDPKNPAQSLDYLNAVLDYCFEGMPAVDFVPQDNPHRHWYHVPMMTTSTFARREPLHGLTRERNLDENSGLGLTGETRSYAIGLYNNLGGYTLGQIWHDADPSTADPSKSQFPENTVVFKLIFLEYDSGTFVPGGDLLVDAPQWQIQDFNDGSTINVRLFQVDIGVKDEQAPETGWVFGTFAYDKDNSATDPWDRLAAVGLIWGNDPTVTPTSGTVVETWLNPARPAFTTSLHGWAGRLNGPVDNPNSSCMSCHSTAQYLSGERRPAPLVWSSDSDCDSDAKRLLWFRNLSGATAFGKVDNCQLDATAAPTPLDYSLQVAVGLESSLFFNNPNPCQAGPPAPAPAAVRARASAAPTAAPEKIEREDAIKR